MSARGASAAIGAARRVAVVGAGWAGLAAALEACRLGHDVTLYEMASQAGGRAREVPGHEAHGGLDNGQHILIGAYVETLALMRSVGVDPAHALLRLPLAMVYPDGDGLRLKAGSAVPAFVAAVLGQRRWKVAERLSLLRAAAGWRLRGFACPDAMTVAELTQRLPRRIRASVIDPLCIAALNTPALQASAAVFLRVLRDALFGAPGAADLLLPKRRLSALLPTPALARLAAAGAQLRLARRVHELTAAGAAGCGWRVDGEHHDCVVLATTAGEAARLTAAIDPAWSACTAALRHEPIITLNLLSPGTRLALPLLALHADDAARPVQFVFDQGHLDGPPGVLTAVISGATPWLQRGAAITIEAAIDQLQEAFGERLGARPTVLKVLTDKRATFLCTPTLLRPAGRVADGLFAAGDFIAGPYPATLEGAVRSGLAAAREVGA